VIGDQLNSLQEPLMNLFVLGHTPCSQPQDGRQEQTSPARWLKKTYSKSVI
jgi:hypothetical protein